MFDSVERKTKLVETPLEYKKKLVLDQEKSKHSLAQIYEKEYLDQQAALDPENAEKEEEEPQSHKEVKKMMQDLFRQLDALSNFHFSPKPAVPELKVVSNLPAVNMEEVAPVTSSDAALLAPEEIRNKARGDILGRHLDLDFVGGNNNNILHREGHKCLCIAWSYSDTQKTKLRNPKK